MIEAVDQLGILTMAEAAAMLGITPDGALKAAMRGTLAARRIGRGQRSVWITTAEDVVAYRVTHAEDRRRTRP